MRRHRFLLFLAVVFAAKLIVVLQLRDHPLLQPDTGLDTTVYTTLARQAVAGNWTLGPGLYFVSPLYIYFLASILSITESFTAARVFQALLGTAAVGCIFVAAREWFGPRAGWLAAFLAALTGLFTFHEVLLLQAALDPFLTSAALAALALAFGAEVRAGAASRAAPAWSALSGFAFGIQSLNRPNVLIPAIAIAALLVCRAFVRGGWRAIPRGLFLAAGLVVALVPLTARNLVVAGDWSPASSHGGLNFYIGNNSEADGTYHPVPGITPNIQGQQEDARRVAETSVGRKLDDGEVSAYFYGLGWTWMRLHPADAVKLFIRKVVYVFNAGYISLNYSYGFYAYDMRTLLALLFVGPWLLLPLGLVGLALGIVQAGERRGDYLIWLSFVPGYAVAVAIFFVTERYRLPLLVPLTIGSGALLDHVWSLFRLRADTARLAEATRAAEAMRSAQAMRAAQKSRGARQPATVVERAPADIASASPARRGFSIYADGGAAVALIGLAFVTNRPLHADDGRTEERTRMAEAMVVRERFDEAERWVTTAEQDNPHPGVLHFRVGRLLLVHNKPGTALNHFQRAKQLEPNQPADYAIGQALLDANRPKEAIPHLEAALKAGVQAELAGFDLARARAAIGDRAGALQLLQSLKPQDANDFRGWNVLGQLALQLEAPSLGAAFFTQAVRVAPRAPKSRQDLGVALSMMGRYTEAIVQFEQAAALDASDPAAHLNLAVAYAEAGRAADARRQAQEALRLKPDYERARQFLGKLR